MTKVRYILIALLSIMVCATFVHSQTPAAPTGLTATAFERHIELQWQPSSGTNIYRYNIYRSEDGGATYTFLQGTPPTTTFFTDWTGDEGLNLTRTYQVKAESVIGVQSDYSNAATGTTADMNDDALRDMVSQATFRYFWDFAHPISGLARERNTSGETVTTGGFRIWHFVDSSRRRTRLGVAGRCGRADDQNRHLSAICRPFSRCISALDERDQRQCAAVQSV